MSTATANTGHRTCFDAEPIVYDQAYFDRFRAYSGTSICRELNESRVNLVDMFVEQGLVLDFGCGACQFLDAIGQSYYTRRGYDICEASVDALRCRPSAYHNPFEDGVDQFAVVTFWGSLEHLQHPKLILSRIRPGQFAMVSMPVYDDVSEAHLSKHWKPGERWHYFSPAGFSSFMADLGFSLRHYDQNEVRIGREGIGTFVFQKTEQTK